LQGWDWVQSTPDRNTGLWDVATVEVSGDVVIVNPFVRTMNVTVSDNPTAVVKAAASLLNRGAVAVSGRLTFGIEGQPAIDVPVSIPAGGSVDVELGPLALSDIQLWWPHTHGTPAMHTASFVFVHPAYFTLFGHFEPLFYRKRDHLGTLAELSGRLICNWQWG